jgi:hypothetical protein
MFDGLFRGSLGKKRNKKQLLLEDADEIYKWVEDALGAFRAALKEPYAAVWDKAIPALPAHKSSTPKAYACSAFSAVMTGAPSGIKLSGDTIVIETGE